MTKAQVEVITSVERRRRWSRAKKERIVAAAIEPGAVASEVARAAGIDTSQLFRRRRQLCGPTQSAPVFSPVAIAAGPESTAAAPVTGYPLAEDADHNPLERTMREIRRRTRVVSAFPVRPYVRLRREVARPTLRVRGLLGLAEPILIAGGRAVADYTEVFVGIDVAKVRNAIAIADGERGGEVRFLGEVDASEESMRRVVKRIAAQHGRVHFCYEAGPTGYGLHRLITSLGHSCIVVAPSLIPRKPGDQVKTNRRDAIALAKLLRAGELTAVWVPDEGHEAMRDLVRGRAAAVETLRVHRQQVSAFMLKHGRIFPRKKGWTMRYLRWLQEQKFEHPAHQIVLQEMVEAVRLSKERVERLERTIEEFVPSWSLAPVVRALQSLRGVDLIVAVTFVTEIGDVRRFENPRQLMGFLGLVPSERSTGATVRRGGITKAGNGRVRHMLVESAWTYRHPPRIGAKKLYRLEQVPPTVRDIAWKAQTRLTARYRALTGRGKKTTVVCTAIARELVGFMWSVAREAQTASA